MKVAPIPSNAASDVPIEELANNRALTEQQKIAEVSRQFESLLLRQILQETQKTVIPSKYADNSTTAGIYQDMVTKQLADSISKSGTVGLAQSLERQLTRQPNPGFDGRNWPPCGSKIPPASRSGHSPANPFKQQQTFSNIAHQNP